MRVFFILMFIIIQIFANTLNQISQTQAKREEDRLKFIESQKESSGSLTKTALHSLVGGSINAIQGESFIDGAIISGINELLSPLSSNLNKDEQILTSQPTGILTGALINSEAGAKQGYNLTTSAEMYNRQLHKDEIKFINKHYKKVKEYYKRQKTIKQHHKLKLDN